MAGGVARAGWTTPVRLAPVTSSRSSGLTQWLGQTSRPHSFRRPRRCAGDGGRFRPVAPWGIPGTRWGPDGGTGAAAHFSASAEVSRSAAIPRPGMRPVTRSVVAEWARIGDGRTPSVGTEQRGEAGESIRFSPIGVVGRVLAFLGWSNGPECPDCAHGGEVPCRSDERSFERDKRSLR